MLNLSGFSFTRKVNYLTRYALAIGQTVGWCLSRSLAFIVVLLIIRQEAQEQPITCPVDREALDRERVNNLFFRSSVETIQR